MSFSDDGYDQHACKLVGSAQSNLDIELGELRRRPMGKGDWEKGTGKRGQIYFPYSSFG